MSTDTKLPGIVFSRLPELEHGCRIIYAGSPCSFALVGLEHGHVGFYTVRLCQRGCLAI